MGTGFSFPGGTTVYIRQTAVGAAVQYSTDQVSWSPIYWSVSVENSNTSLGFLKIEFTTDITLSGGESGIGGVNGYFVCNSTKIQFGSESLKEDGTRPVLTIDGINDYPGLIANGNNSSNGNNDIRIFNLEVRATNGSTLSTNGGWIGQAYFGKGATNNYIVNCSSTGGIPDSGGGIIGAYAASETGSLTIRGCSSSGVIGNNGGGILGSNAADNGGTLTCEQCWSEGLIGQYAGGIIGINAGVDGTVTVTKCYSLGDIGTGAGGIIGSEAADSGVMTVSNSYSRGDIGANGGGIFGSLAALNGGSTNAINCYTEGTIVGGGSRGIYGTDPSDDGIYTNCYPANGNWSDEWANDGLTGIPSGSGVGTSWVSREINQPYELNAIGYTPYATTNINSSSDLIQTYSQTISVGESTTQAIKINTDPSGNDFTILLKTGGDTASYTTITMNSQTGAVSTNSATVPGTYTLTVRSVGSYFITTFMLIVIEAPPQSQSLEAVSCCSRPLVVKDVDYTTLNNLLAGNIMIGSTTRPRQPISYRDVYNKKMAYASKG